MCAQAVRSRSKNGRESHAAPAGQKVSFRRQADALVCSPHPKGQFNFCAAQQQYTASNTWPNAAVPISDFREFNLSNRFNRTDGVSCSANVNLPEDRAELVAAAYERPSRSAPSGGWGVSESDASLEKRAAAQPGRADGFAAAVACHARMT